jgi:lipopolysaccharide biosynthesis glycosyltransferase
MWLEDADIGELPVTWNFLVGHNELAKEGAYLPKAIHFTCGGPWFEAWKDCEFADYWFKERDEYWNTQCTQRVVRHRELLKLVNIRMHDSTTSQREGHPLGKSKQQKRLKEGCSIADSISNALCL